MNAMVKQHEIIGVIILMLDVIFSFRGSNSKRNVGTLDEEEETAAAAGPTRAKSSKTCMSLI